MSAEFFETVNGMNCITLAGMQEAAKHAITCVRVIRQNLPVEGFEWLGDILTADAFYSAACRQCFEFFRYQPYGFLAAVTPAEIDALYWNKLCGAMREIQLHYGWQEIEFDNRIPHSDVRGGQVLPAIEESILLRVEMTASQLDPSVQLPILSRKLSEPSPAPATSIRPSKHDALFAFFKELLTKQPDTTTAASAARSFYLSLGPIQKSNLLESHGGSPETVIAYLKGAIDEEAKNRCGGIRKMLKSLKETL